LGEFDDVLQRHNAEMAAKDKEQFDQLLKDVTTGNLRKRRKDGGLYLDDDDDDDEDLEILRDIKRAADFARRYDSKKKNGDEMTAIEKLGMSNPQLDVLKIAFFRVNRVYFPHVVPCVTLQRQSRRQLLSV